MTTVSRAERKAGVDTPQVVHAGVAHAESGGGARDCTPWVQRMRERRLEKRAGRRLGCRHQVSDAALRHYAAAAHAGGRTDVDQVRRTADRVFVMLDDDQRVALGFELLQGVEQDAVVARVQADRRLVEHVRDALQVGAQLRGEADALRFAAGQRWRGAIEREVAEADFLEER